MAKGRMLKAKFINRNGLQSRGVAKKAGLPRCGSCRLGPLTRRVLAQHPRRVGARGLQINFVLPRESGRDIQDYSGLFRFSGEWGRTPCSRINPQKIKVAQGCSSWIKVAQGILKHFFYENGE